VIEITSIAKGGSHVKNHGWRFYTQRSRFKRATTRSKGI
jgi:hypothetical protein